MDKKTYGKEGIEENKITLFYSLNFGVFCQHKKIILKIKF